MDESTIAYSRDAAVLTEAGDLVGIGAATAVPGYLAADSSKMVRRHWASQELGHPHHILPSLV